MKRLYVRAEDAHTPDMSISSACVARSNAMFCNAENKKVHTNTMSHLPPTIVSVAPVVCIPDSITAVHPGVSTRVSCILYDYTG